MRASIALLFFLLSACASKPQPFLYRVSDQWRQFLIFGTIHRGVTANEISPLVRTALASADHAYFESDWLQDPNHSHLRLLIRDKEPTLDQRMSPEEFQFLDAAVARAAPDLAASRRKSLRPFTALTLLQSTRRVQLPSDVAKAYAPENAIEPMLMREAQSLRTVTSILEDPASESCLDDVDRSSLKKIQEIFEGQTPENEFAETETLAKAYRTGQSERVAKAALRVENLCLIRDRNQRWSQLFAQMNGLAFAAVDVGQLVSLDGQPSLLTLMQDRGFVIQRLSLP